MKIKRRGSAAWQGGLKDGKGTLSTESGGNIAAYPYGFASRFEGVRQQPGRTAGGRPRRLFHHGVVEHSRRSEPHGRKDGDIRRSHARETRERLHDYGIASDAQTLKFRAQDQATFEQLAAKAKANCPVSKLFKAEISLEAKLVN